MNVFGVKRIRTQTGGLGAPEARAAEREIQEVFRARRYTK